MSGADAGNRGRLAAELRMLKSFFGRCWSNHWGNLTWSSEFERRNPRRGNRCVRGGLSGPKVEWDIEASCMDKEEPSDSWMSQNHTSPWIAAPQNLLCLLSWLFIPCNTSQLNSLYFLSTVAFKGNGSPITESTQTNIGQALGGCAADRRWVFPGCLSNSSMWKSECRKETSSPPRPALLSLLRVGHLASLLCRGLPNFFCMYVPLSTLSPPFQHISHMRWNRCLGNAG